MNNEISTQSSGAKIDSFELLSIFVNDLKQKAEKNDDRKVSFISCGDILTAVYYYRMCPNVNTFIEKYMIDKRDYFQLMWVRATWGRLSAMSDKELSDLVINQMDLVANLDE